MTETGPKHSREQYGACTSKYGISLGPWKWTLFNGSPQLECGMRDSEMGPVLIAFGCGNKKPDTDIEGCMPALDGDPLRGCPLHPTREDRSQIEAVPDLLIERDALAAENARLREALTKLVDVHDRGAFKCMRRFSHMAQAAMKKASDALSTPAAPDPRDEQIESLKNAVRTCIGCLRGTLSVNSHDASSYGDALKVAYAALEGGA